MWYFKVNHRNIYRFPNTYCIPYVFKVMVRLGFRETIVRLVEVRDRLSYNNKWSYSIYLIPLIFVTREMSVNIDGRSEHIVMNSLRVKPKHHSLFTIKYLLRLLYFGITFIKCGTTFNVDSLNTIYCNIIISIFFL